MYTHKNDIQSKWSLVEEHLGNHGDGVEFKYTSTLQTKIPPDIADHIILQLQSYCQKMNKERACFKPLYSRRKSPFSKSFAANTPYSKT